ncbi:hypothetical protein, partial [Flavobacterium sp.]|uniref:DUF6443 domain-containing protein n=1 Tax=Flavobacterium sp. TaxID=239 RepID=UPI003D6BF2B5
MNLKKYSNRIILVLTLLFGLIANAQVEEREYSRFTPELNTASTISLQELNDLGSYGVTVYDSEAGFPYQKDKDPYCFLSLFIDSAKGPFEWYEAKATFNITPLMPDGTPDTANRLTGEMIVSYNPNDTQSGLGTNFSDLNYLQVKNRYGLKVEVVPNSIYVTKMPGGASISLPKENVFVKLGFKVKRYYSVSEQMIQPNAVLQNPNTLKISWNALQGALGYELEWTWVDAYKDNSLSGLLPESDITFSERDFELNNTRITTNKQEYEIPLIYSKGYLIYRIRPVGRNVISSSDKFYGSWSSGTAVKTKVSDWPHKFIINGDHEAKKNWQFQASYAEDGKKKEVVSYFDGSLRNRQTVTKINSDANAVVGEVIYDAQGRPAIEVLPAPTLDQSIHYFKNYNRNENNIPYSYKDFDYDSGTCDTNVPAMANASGASGYYSPNSPFLNQGRVNYSLTPDAGKYPFSQIEYTSDNTGRIARKGGVGTTYQLDSGHEMKYFYDTPTQPELNRLFGYSVGDATHYKKNTVIDPNGQISVSYIDPHGRTIATALAGSTPENGSVVGLEDEASSNPNHSTVTEDLLENQDPNHFDTPADKNILGSTEAFPNNNDQLVLAKSFTVEGNGIGHKLDYTIKNSTSFSPLYCPGGQFPFVYDLKISLKDNCGTDIAGFTKIDQKIGNANFNGTPSSIDLSFNNPEFLLNAGNYNLVKELTVNKDTLNKYADFYVEKLTKPESGCYQDPQFFGPNVNMVVTCDLTCDSCNTKVGEKAPYVQTALRDYFDDTSFVATESGGTITVTYMPSLSIDSAVVTALKVRFIREWELLKEECNKICHPEAVFETACEINEKSLLSDVSLHGQYGSVKPNITDEVTNVSSPNPDFLLSVFNENGALYYFNSTTNQATVTDHNWKHPVIPYNENGVAAMIQVTPNSDLAGHYLPEIDQSAVLVVSNAPDGSEIYKVKPEELKNLSDFIANWDDDWAYSLLPYHPEYAYLEYGKAVCASEKDFTVPTVDVNGNPTGSTTIRMSSDGYDSYLRNIDTFAKAENKFISLGSSDADKQLIFANDPYFQQLSAEFEDNTLYNYRKGIMAHALLQNYIGTEVLFQTALRSVICNPLSDCTNLSGFNVSSLSTEKKNLLWNTYKALYLGLKANIKQVFSNIYAFKKHAFNGCIGGNTSTSVTNVLTDNFPQKSALYQHVNGIVGASGYGYVCNSASGHLYSKKQKRFIQSDFAYNSGVSPQDALDDLIAQTDYEYYMQTGNCPLLVDLNMFLDYFLKDTTLGNKTNLSNISFTGQYLTKDLLQALITVPGATVLDPATMPLQNIKINTSVNSNTLSVSYSGQLKSGISFSTCATTISIPSGSYTWGNYGTFWTVKEIKQIYYDQGASDVANKIFKYKAIAVIHIGSNDLEIPINGQTCAAIGECGTAVGSVGGVLDPYAGTSAEGASCNRRYKFRNDMVPFLNQLKATNKLKSTTEVDLNTFSTYKNSFLAEFFGDNPATTIATKWVKDSGAEVYYFKRNGIVLATINAALPDPASFNTFEGFRLTGATVSNTKIYTSASNGTTSFVTGNTNSVIEFNCCTAKAVGEGKYNLNVMLRKQVSNSSLAGGKLYYQDIVFTPKDYSFAVGENLDITITLNSSDFLFNKTAHNPMISIGGFSEGIFQGRRFDFSTNTLQFKVNGYADSSIATHLPPKSRLSWNSYYPASFETRSDLAYDFTSAYGTVGAKFHFTEGQGNTTVSTSSSVMNLSSNSWLNGQPYALSFSTEREASWDINNSFTFDGGISGSIGFNVKLTAPLSKLADNSGYFGHLLQIDSQDSNNANNLYQIMVYATEATTCSESSVCPPQTLVPIACDDSKRLELLDYLDLSNGTYGTSAKIPGYQVDEHDFDNFCASNYQYLLEAYVRYTDILEVPSSSDTRFRTIAEFGNTYLHYGFSGINAVIAEYKTYYTQIPQPANLLNWNEWVETIYRPNHTLCPSPPAAIPFYTPQLPNTDDSDCEALVTNLNETYGAEAYNNFLQEKRRDFIAKYIKDAMSKVAETFEMKYFDKEYQYTLYYYDQAGNLTQTVAPEGVRRLSPTQLSEKNTLINTYRKNANINTADDFSLQPEHIFKTQYKYNSLNQLVWQSTPDGGETRFAYDNLGRIIASQNANQDSDNKVNLNFTLGSKIAYDNNGNLVNIHPNDDWIGWINAIHGYTDKVMEGNGYIEREVGEPRENINTILGICFDHNQPATGDSFLKTRYGIYINQNQTLLYISTDAAGNQLFTSNNIIVKRGDKLKMERKDGFFNFYVNNNLVATKTDYSTSISQALVTCDLFWSKTKLINPKAVNYGSAEKFSYTQYDGQGRITEAGQVQTPVSANYTITDEGRLTKNNVKINDFGTGLVKSEVTKTVYDIDPLVESGLTASKLFVTNTNSTELKYNNRNRVTGVFYYDSYSPNDELAFDNAILYNYDVHGNVKEMISYYAALRDLGCLPDEIGLEISREVIINDCEAHLKRVVYDYDLISGNVNTVTFQPNKTDQFIHKYAYDADNRIVEVNTSRNGLIWERDARYQYYPHGPLARVDLGDKHIQGVDYAYTLQGWLKAVNGENLKSAENVMNNDGASPEAAPRDAYGYSLSYYDGDYKAIAGDNGTAAFKPLMFSRNNTIASNSRNLYNGNIKQMTTAIRTGGENLLNVQKNNYTYDQLNRIKAMTSAAIEPSASGIQSSNAASYSSSYEYDRNGNLKTMQRTAPTGTSTGSAIQSMDNLQYDYLPGNNKLTLVKDTNASTHDFGNDLKDQIKQLGDLGISYDIHNLNSHNYVYDEIGQLIEDKSEHLKINWRVDGKVSSVIKNDAFSIRFTYDGLGNRIAKTTLDMLERDEKSNTSLYARDAQGNVLGVYSYDIIKSDKEYTKDLKIKEHHIYGSSRLGLEEEDLLVYKFTPGRSGKMMLKQTMVNQNVELTVVPYKDYALHFNGNTTASWNMNLPGATPLANPEIDNFELNTKLKLTGTNANGNYAIGQLIYQGDKMESIGETEAGLFDMDLTCGQYNTTNRNISKLTTGGCSSVSGSGFQPDVLGAEKDGYLQYNFRDVGVDRLAKAGFTINNKQYGFRFDQTSSTMYAVCNNTETALASVVSGNTVTLKVERKGDDMKFYCNQTLGYTTTIADISNYVADVYVNLGTGSSTLYAVIAAEYNPAVNVKVTNQLFVSLNKTDQGYKPVFEINQFKTTPAQVTTKRSITLAHDTLISELDMKGKGMEISFNLELSTANNSAIIVNGVSQAYPGVAWSSTPVTATLPVSLQNQLSGTINGVGPLSGMDMCYLNYEFLHIATGGVRINSFGFDDVTSETTTNNPPKDANGIIA